MESLVETKIKVKPQDTKKIITKSSKISIIFISLIIGFLFSFMVIDYYSINKKIDTTASNVNQKIDSLDTYVNSKIYTFEKNNETQQSHIDKAKTLSNF